LARLDTPARSCEQASPGLLLVDLAYLRELQSLILESVTDERSPFYSPDAATRLSSPPSYDEEGSELKEEFRYVKKRKLDNGVTTGVEVHGIHASYPQHVPANKHCQAAHKIIKSQCDELVQAVVRPFIGIFRIPRLQLCLQDKVKLWINLQTPKYVT
jgi:hypothetical protein